MELGLGSSFLRWAIAGHRILTPRCLELGGLFEM